MKCPPGQLLDTGHGQTFNEVEVLISHTMSRGLGMSSHWLKRHSVLGRVSLIFFSWGCWNIFVLQFFLMLVGHHFQPQSKSIRDKAGKERYHSTGCHFPRELTNIVHRKCLESQEILMEIFLIDCFF